MTLLEQITADLKEAMARRDELVVSVLRLIKSAVHNQEIAKMKKDKGLTAEEVLEVIATEAKKRRDSIDAFAKGGRDDLVSQETKELKIIERYLPKPLAEDELSKIIKQVIAASADKNFGKIMGQVMSRVKGQADGTVVAKLVKAALGRQKNSL
jgi:uncharacterized protein YqeY